MLLGVGLAFGGSQLLAKRETAPKTVTPAPATQKSQAPAQSVTIAEVKLASVSRTLAATGTVAAFELLPVMAQATGLKIEQVLVAEGDFVQRGQTLVRLNNATLQAQLTQAQAGVAQAEARVAELRAGSRNEEVARAREGVRSAEAGVTQAESDLNLAQQRAQRNRFLQGEGAIARDRLDEVLNIERNAQAALAQARARLQEARQQLVQVESGARPETIAQAEAQLAQAKGQVQLVTSQLNETRVVAPASGKIATRGAYVGDLTSSSKKLFEMIQNGRLEVQLKVPETQLAQIRPGQSVQLSSDADSKLKFNGTVREIDPTIDPQSRQATVKVDLADAPGLKPGMFLRAAIVTSAATGLTAPTAAILPQSDGSAISYVVQPDNTVKAKTVKAGKILPNGQVEIESGLSSGDRVVLKGAAYLKEGDRVEIKN
ncbi:efflux RND transporter periplasmic adaptor subunit [Oscillatoria sp. FACHB-1406]|nr:efflux RND transporter periplasmic adaptor subunit [Oscillatoria sp. FACHB-1406]MBD2579839.1 efflux RND transporter periplasmic adaptor subunit [Oscillatoria sp. FACHB-1406]